MKGNNFYDPGLHLFLDDVEVQDHPGFVRKVQRPERVRTEPVLRPDRPWEGEAVQLWGSVLYDDDENCFKMWYYSSNNDLYERTGQGALYVLCDLKGRYCVGKAGTGDCDL